MPPRQKATGTGVSSTSFIVDDPAAAQLDAVLADQPPVDEPDPAPDADADQAVAPDCPTPEACFPQGVPADTYSAGCQHGTWTLTAE